MSFYFVQKHGIVLGPDLNVNGDVGETETDGTSSGDTAARPAQDSQPSPTEGNSMLGKHCGKKTSFLLPAWLGTNLTEDFHFKMFQISPKTENNSVIISLNLFDLMI